MPQFNWIAHPEAGGCLSCLAQVNDKGFVDTYADVDVARAEYSLDGAHGWSDVVFCADCIHQIGRLVGMAAPAEVEAFAYREHDLMETNEKLKDEIASWQQRMETLIGLKVEDLGLDMPDDDVVNAHAESVD